MASSSALKMATLLVLALFAGQLLMAVPTLAFLPGFGDTTCFFSDPTCINPFVLPLKNACFSVAYLECIKLPYAIIPEHPDFTVTFCKGVAFAYCNGDCKKY
jgi:hypothetical protein